MKSAEDEWTEGGRNKPDDGLVERLEASLPEDFSRALLKGALAALTQDNVATRVQHFSISMRELSQYLLEQLAPDDDVIKRCAWFKQNPDFDRPSRRQRALCASRGGLTDSFLKSALKLDSNEFHADIGLQEMNKRTHLRSDTVITDPAEIESSQTKRSAPCSRYSK